MDELKKILDPMSLEEIRLHVKLILNFYSELILKFHKSKVNTELEAHNQMILQMFFSKGLYIHNILEGVSFENGAIRMNKIIDHSILFTLVRNLYEALCSFELVSVIPMDDEQKNIMYNLYCISGLKYRQQFYDESTNLEYKEIYINEKNELEVRIDNIEKSSFFKGLDEANQKQIHNAIKCKSYKIVLGKTIKRVLWKDIVSLMGIKKGVLDNMYSYYCLHAHPSYISRLQFEEAFKLNNPQFVQLSMFAAKNAIMFLSIFISDYIKLNPHIRVYFNSPTNTSKNIINIYNDVFRGPRFVI